MRHRWKELAKIFFGFSTHAFFEREAGVVLLKYSQSDGQGTPCDSGTVAPL
jgi:hypothetical protein